MLASAPQVSLKFSMRALSHGMLAPTSMELLGARATIVRTEAGQYRLALGPPSAAGGDMLGRFADVLLAPPDPTRSLGYLRRISIVGVRLDVKDRLLKIAWTAPKADMIFARDRAGIRVDAALELELGGSVARLSGSGTYRRTDGKTETELHFSGLRPASVAARFPQFAALAPVNLPLAGTLQATFDRDGALLSGGFDVNAGAGEVVAPELWSTPLDVSGAHVRGTLAHGPDRVEIEEGALSLGGGARLGLTGSAMRKNAATEINATVNLVDMPVDAFDRYWPKEVAAGARAWTVANLEHGNLTEGHVTASLKLGEADKEMTLETMSGGFRMAGTSVHYLRPLPPVAGGVATATFDATSMTITGGGARLGGLSVDETTVKFTHIERRIADASVEVVVRGPLREALELLDHPRFRYMQKLGIDPKGVEGTTATRLVVTFPTAVALKFSDIGIRAAANLRGVAVHKALLGRDLTDGDLVMKLDRDGMDVSGKARVAGVPSEIVWVENFDPKARIARRYKLTGTVDAQDRARLGVDTAPYATGPMAVDLALAQPSAGPSELQMRLGLDSASLALPELDWSKPAGTPGTATMLATLAGGRLSDIRQVTLEAGTLDAVGRATLGPDGGGIERAEIDRFHVGGTDLRAVVARRKAGGFDITLQGQSLDAAPLIRRAMNAGADAKTTPPLHITLRLDRLGLPAGRPLAGAVGALNYDGTRWTDARLDGAMPGGHRIALRYDPDGTGQRLTVASDDAGEALRLFGVYDNIQGGKLHLDARRGGAVDVPWRGMLRMEDFRLVQAPALARVLTVASLSGIGNLLSGKGISFARLMMPFSFKDGRLEIDKSRAAGSEIGITADGTLDFDHNTAKVNGTIVPAYSINSVLGKIPLLGILLTGEEGSGVFAATYQLDGRLDDPNVKVNPLAALAPGFLRDLVDGLTKGGTNEPMPMPRNMP